MKYLIYGKGWLGNKFKQYFADAEISLSRVLDSKTIVQELNEKQPKIVINCIGITGNPNIDWCESHKNETLFGNVTVPLLLLDACQQTNTPLMHIGSGCIYEGDNNGTGFSEEDPPNFFGSFYSRTKILAEQALKEFPVLQLRLRMPLDSVPNKKNLITKLVGYKKVISVKNSISVIDDLLFAAKKLIDKKKVGVYNVVNPNPIEHSEILDLYKEIVDSSFKYEIMALTELEKITKAKRSNCVLSTRKLEGEGIHLDSTKVALKRIFKEYKNHLQSNIELQK